MRAPPNDDGSAGPVRVERLAPVHHDVDTTLISDIQTVNAHLRLGCCGRHKARTKLVKHTT
jgi:hypothetical protein